MVVTLVHDGIVASVMQHSTRSIFSTVTFGQSVGKKTADVFGKSEQILFICVCVV